MGPPATAPVLAQCAWAWIGRCLAPPARAALPPPQLWQRPPRCEPSGPGTSPSRRWQRGEAAPTCVAQTAHVGPARQPATAFRRRRLGVRGMRGQAMGTATTPREWRRSPGPCWRQGCLQLGWQAYRRTLAACASPAAHVAIGPRRDCGPWMRGGLCQRAWASSTRRATSWRHGPGFLHGRRRHSQRRCCLNRDPSGWDGSRSRSHEPAMHGLPAVGCGA